MPFTLPELDADHHWQRVFDTAEPEGPEFRLKGDGPYPLQGRSLAVFTVSPPLRERRRGAATQQAADGEPAKTETEEPVAVEG